MIKYLIIGLSDREKMQVLDLPVALMMLAMGVLFVARRKRNAAIQEGRVRSGEISSDEATKNVRLIWRCGWALVAIGLILFGMWAFHHLR